MNFPISVVVIEDDLDFKANIFDILSTAPETKLLASFTGAEPAIQQLATIQPDIVLIDLDLNGDSGIRVINTIKQLNSKIEFIVLTVLSDDKSLFYALKAGASGYLLKDTPEQNLIKSIVEVMSGGAPISPIMAKFLTDYFVTKKDKKTILTQLTQREQQILDLLSEGYVAKKIAQKFNISYETVRCHQKNIYTKLHVHSLYEAITINKSPW